MESVSQEITKNFKKNTIFLFTCDLTPSYWQTPKISKFAQLDWRFHQTRGEGCYSIEVKHLMRALGGPHEYLGVPKGPFSGGIKGYMKEQEDAETKARTDGLSRKLVIKTRGNCALNSKTRAIPRALANHRAPTLIGFPYPY